MPQNSEKTLREETAAVEMRARELIDGDIAQAVQVPQIRTADTVRPVPVKEDTNRNRKDRRNPFKREIYGDRTVPRIRPERRFGTTARSRAYLKYALYVYSDRAQLVFERNYERTNMNLYVGVIVSEVFGGTDFAQTVSDSLEKACADFQEKLMKSIRELKRIADKNGIAPADQTPSYDHKRFYEVPLHTPQSCQFMTIVELFDTLIRRADGLWLKGKMSLQTHKNLVSSWEKRLAAFVNEIFTIRQKATTEARSRGAGKRVAAIEQDFRRELAAEKLQGRDVKTETDANAQKPAAPVSESSENSIPADEQAAEPLPSAS